MQRDRHAASAQASQVVAPLTAHLAPQPERHVRRLHRLADDVLEVGAQRVELDLLAQPRPERLERALGVVAAAVEAPVDEPLHARAQRAGRARRRRASSTAIARSPPPANGREDRLPGEHQADVRGAEDTVSEP